MTRIPIDAQKVKERIHESDLSYEEVCLESAGLFQKHTLKYALNAPRPRLSGKEVEALASILDCDSNVFVDASFIRNLGIPGRINCLISDLYVEEREDINVNYEKIFEHHRKAEGFNLLLGQGKLLFNVLTDPKLEDDYVLRVLKAITLIRDHFGPQKEMRTSWLGLPVQDIEWLIDLIDHAGEEYTPQHTILTFVYCLALFESIFLEEMVASAAELSLGKAKDKVQQYYLLSGKVERLRDAYVDYVIHQKARFDSPLFVETGMEKRFFDDTLLLIAACDRCISHLDSNKASSEYVNRKVLNSILNALIKTAHDTQIVVRDEEISGIWTSRFGRRFLEFRMVINAMNPPPQKQPKFDPNMAFMLGYWSRGQ